MGFFSPSTSWKANPYLFGETGDAMKTGPSTIKGLEDWSSGITLGTAGEVGQDLLNKLREGNYKGLAQTMLAPIGNMYATKTRDTLRDLDMGGNRLFYGGQPQLRAAMEQDTRARMAQEEALAYTQAIPQLLSQASNMYQGGLNQQENMQLAALSNALRARMGGAEMVKGPSTFQNIMGVAGAVASLI